MTPPDWSAFVLLDPAARAERDWHPFRPGIEVSWLYRDGDDGAAAALLRYAAGAEVPHHRHAGFEHILVLEGSQTDHRGRHGAGLSSSARRARRMPCAARMAAWYWPGGRSRSSSPEPSSRRGGGRSASLGDVQPIQRDHQPGGDPAAVPRRPDGGRKPAAHAADLPWPERTGGASRVGGARGAWRCCAGAFHCPGRARHRGT